MKNRFQIFYSKSPMLAQNIMLSLYGYKLNQIRYGKGFKSAYQKILANLNYNKNELDGYIETKLRFIIKHSVLHVPYYRELFKDNQIDIKDINTTDDLKKIPLLQKEVLRETPNRLIDERVHPKKLLRIHTTGTTGTPLNIYCNSHVRQLNYAFYERFLNTNHINTKGHRATLGGRIIVNSEQKQPPFWRYSCFQKNYLYSSYHLTENNIPYYIEHLKKIRPNYIDAYPSSLYAISEFAFRKGISLRNITKAITTSAETLFAHQRERIETQFGIQIFDQYGAAEMCTFVSQCVKGKYHIHTDYGLIEFLREDGTKARSGEEAEIVCTGLINNIMPLIRYRIGDRGILSDEKCECGSHFPIMDQILGRMDDVIVTPDGRKIGRLSPVLKGFPVKEAQYFQKEKEKLIVFVIKDKGYSLKTSGEIIGELRKRLGDEITIDIQIVNKIPRSSGAKLRSVVSLLSR